MDESAVQSSCDFANDKEGEKWIIYPRVAPPVRDAPRASSSSQSPLLHKTQYTHTLLLHKAQYTYTPSLHNAP